MASEAVPPATGSPAPPDTPTKAEAAETLPEAPATPDSSAAKESHIPSDEPETPDVKESKSDSGAEDTPGLAGENVSPATPETSLTPPPWREKAGVFVQQSSVKLSDAANKASVAVAGAAEVTGSRVKATWDSTREGWQTNVQPRVQSMWQTTKEGWQQTVLPRVDAAAKAAAETGTKIRMGIMQTRERVASAAIHKRVAEATTKSFERSRSFLVKMEILPPELNPRAVFGVPLEKVVSYQNTVKPIPHIVTACCDYIENEGMLTEYIFDDEGDPVMITRLMKTYERDDQSNIPPGYIARDVAQLLLAFFRCLPEPLLTYKLYDEVVSVGGGDALRLKELLGSLAAANLATLERVTVLLSRIAAEQELTKMDAEALAVEWAPVLLWKKGLAPGTAAVPAVSQRSASQNDPPPPHQDPIDGSPIPAEDVPKEEGAAAPAAGQANGEASETEASAAPAGPDAEELDMKEQRAVVEAVKCLIEQYEVVFKEPEAAEEHPSEAPPAKDQQPEAAKETAAE